MKNNPGTENKNSELEEQVVEKTKKLNSLKEMYWREELNLRRN